MVPHRANVPSPNGRLRMNGWRLTTLESYKRFSWTTNNLPVEPKRVKGFSKTQDKVL